MKLTNAQAIVVHLLKYGTQRASVLRQVAYENTHGVGAKLPHRGWYASYFSDCESPGSPRCGTWWVRANGNGYDRPASQRNVALWKLTKEGKKVARQLLVSILNEKV